MTTVLIILLLIAGFFWYRRARQARLDAQQAMRRLYRGPIRRARRAAYRQRKSTRGGRYISKELRAAIWKRDGGFCQHCGVHSSTGVRMELDHIVPYSWGGRTNYENLILSCHTCNAKKGNNWAGIGDNRQTRAQYEKAHKVRS